jgi:hypothetical protein
MQEAQYETLNDEVQKTLKLPWTGVLRPPGTGFL